MWKEALAALFGVVVVFVVWDEFDPEIIRNKRVVITGASMGIGEQLAYEYAKLGAKVLITSRTNSTLQKVIARCRDVGSVDGEYYYIAGDMMDLDFTAKVIQEADARLGGIDYLVLNHLVSYRMTPWKGSKDNLTVLSRVMTGCFESYVHLASHALGTLAKSRGSIVIVSSIAGKLGQALSTAYSAAKFALDGFFSGLREDMKLQGKDDISITLCVIGLIGTDSAVANLKKAGQHKMLNLVTPAEPNDAAWAIMKGGANRVREVYFPYWMAKITTLLRDWTPGLLSTVNLHVLTSVT